MNSRNLIRFDWAIKRLLRNKADFTVLEGFLSELIKDEISIDKLKLSIKQTELLGGKVEPFQIFPEYYVIKVNNFNDIAKDTLDQWIYYFKNNEIQDTFNAKGIDMAKELWRVDNLSDDERKKYMKHIEDLRYGASMAWTMKVDAEDKLKKENTIQIARELKSNGASIELIMKSTKLSKDEIEKL